MTPTTLMTFDQIIARQGMVTQAREDNDRQAEAAVAERLRQRLDTVKRLFIQYMAVSHNVMVPPETVAVTGELGECEIAIRYGRAQIVPRYYFNLRGDNMLTMRGYCRYGYAWSVKVENHTPCFFNSFAEALYRAHQLEDAV